jgi:ribosomal protein S18 acetylase RimI-like enzyme
MYTIRDGRKIKVGSLATEDFPELETYLQQLGHETRQRFGPHSFDLPSIIGQYINPGSYLGYIARDQDTSAIIAYSILKKGFLEHEMERLQSYGLAPDHHNDYTFAPSVSDAWQGKGVGQYVFRHICNELSLMGARRIILWGGVQCSNERAVHYYLKNGFRVLGMFEYNGRNYDMILENLYFKGNSPGMPGLFER